jgi:predicted RNA-binding Zn ribbon-like protein
MLACVTSEGSLMVITQPSHREPGDRAPAPLPLGLVQRFMNTVDLLTHKDIAVTPVAMGVWLTARGLLDTDSHVTDEEFQRALTLRAALRTLVRSHAGVAIDAGVIAIVNQIAGHATFTTQFAEDGGVALVPAAHGVDGALGRLLATVALAACDGSWQRLKACANEECQWVFYDASKNHSSSWCTMKMCGGQRKARAYRARRKAQASSSTEAQPS